MLLCEVNYNSAKPIKAKGTTQGSGLGAPRFGLTTLQSAAQSHNYLAFIPFTMI